jgi:hypothetical protein
MCRKESNRGLIVGVSLAGTSLATLASYPHPFTLPAALGGRTIAWHADLDMFVAVPLLAIAGFLVPGLNRIRFALFVAAVQLSVTALILSRKEWADLMAPYLVSGPVVIYLMRRSGSHLSFGQILQSPRRQLARVWNCQWQAGSEVRTQCPARCGLAVIGKPALVLAKGRNLMARGYRRCRIHWRRHRACAVGGSVGEIA